MQAPMLVLKNNSKRESGRKVQLSNIKAAKTISDIVSSSVFGQCSAIECLAIRKFLALYPKCTMISQIHRIFILKYLTRHVYKVRNVAVFRKFRHIFGPPKFRLSL